MQIVVFSLKQPESVETQKHPEYHQMLAPVVYVPKWKFTFKNIAASLLQLTRFIKYPHHLMNVFMFLAQNKEKKLWYEFLTSIWLATHLKSLGVAHLHAHAATAETTVAMFAAILTNKTFSFTAHASDIFPVQEYLNKKLDAASFVIAISQYNRRFLMDYCDDETDAKKIYVTHPGINLKRLAPFKSNSSPVSNKVFTIITVARLVEQKGHHILLEALAILHNWGYKFMWIVVGSGPIRPQLEEMTQAKQLTEFVDFKGDQQTDEVLKLLQTSDVFVLPCIRTKNNMMDGLPSALIEAMAMGVPVVSTRISGIPELVQNGLTGFLVPPNDSTELAKTLKYLMENREVLNKVRIPAREQVEKNFPDERNADIVHRLFSEYQSRS